ncbi:His-Xaa-Ser system protein HxsD [Pedobacter nutrimenti]|uniref:His-Xaa-Ser system protein HxsD n=1 Tax=Pedobacter nutrimenti TaxID=1241337 RepID=UPI002930E4F2|nr:His-Xaa-Ser system protein HxsD [Pedobacter nutrimenti]
MRFDISSSGLTIVVDGSIYSIDVLHKCFYWYGANFDVVIDDDNQGNLKVGMTSKLDGIDYEETISKIKRDLIDFKLRDIVTKETSTLRDLLVAKAFAYYEEPNNGPSSELSDPVGFDPLAI